MLLKICCFLCAWMTSQCANFAIRNDRELGTLFCSEGVVSNDGTRNVPKSRQSRGLVDVSGSKASGRVSGADSRLLSSFMKVKYFEDVSNNYEADIPWTTFQDNIDRRKDHPFAHLPDSTTSWDSPRPAELILDNHKNTHRHRPQRPQVAHWPQEESPSRWPESWTEERWSSTQRPSQIFSKPFKVTSPTSHVTTGSYVTSPKISDTVLSKPVMVFDSLTGESVQNVKIIHGKVVVAERNEAHNLHSSYPGKINSNFQNTIVIPIVVNPTTAEKPMNTFFQTLPNEAEETTTDNRDLFTFQPSTSTFATLAPTTTTTLAPTTTTTLAPTTTTTLAPATTTTVATTTRSSFIEITFSPSPTTRKPTRKPKPSKKPPRRKPKPKPSRRPTKRPGAALVSLTATPANDPSIQYVTLRPQTSNVVRPVSANVQAINLSPLGYSGLTGMTVVMKTLVGAMLVFLPSALVAAGIITSRRVLPFAKSDDSPYTNNTGFNCEMDCLVQLVADLTGSEPEFIRRINNSTEMISLTNQILELFKD